jgi:hypothetical protein
MVQLILAVIIMGVSLGGVIVFIGMVAEDIRKHLKK